MELGNEVETSSGVDELLQTFEELAISMDDHDPATMMDVAMKKESLSSSLTAAPQRNLVETWIAAPPETRQAPRRHGIPGSPPRSPKPSPPNEDENENIKENCTCLYEEGSQGAVYRCLRILEMIGDDDLVGEGMPEPNGDKDQCQQLLNLTRDVGPADKDGRGPPRPPSNRLVKFKF